MAHFRSLKEAAERVQEWTGYGRLTICREKKGPIGAEVFVKQIVYSSDMTPEQLAVLQAFLDVFGANSARILARKLASGKLVPDKVELVIL